MGDLVFANTYLTALWIFQSDARIKDYHKVHTPLCVTPKVPVNWHDVSTAKQPADHLLSFPILSLFCDRLQNFTSVMFMRWVEKQLIPTFKQKYPGKKMVLILDNAKYHWAYGEGRTSIKEMKIAELVTLAEELEMEDIDFNPDQTNTKGEPISHFRDQAWCERAHFRSTPPLGPYKAEVRDAVMKVAREKDPRRFMSVLQLKMDEEGYELIFTPPYMPDWQPIERLWEHGKSQVANAYFEAGESGGANRSIEDCRQQLQRAFYGGSYLGRQFNAATPELVRKWIAKSERDMNSYIASTSVLQGTVSQLVRLENGASAALYPDRADDADGPPPDELDLAQVDEEHPDFEHDDLGEGDGEEGGAEEV